MLWQTARLIIVAAAACLLVAGEAGAQTALNASPDDAVYSAIDTFVANDLVRDVIYGQRPYTRLEVARILKASRASLEKMEGEEETSSWEAYGSARSRVRYLDALLKHYEKDYAEEIKGMSGGVQAALLSEMDFALVGNSSTPRRVPVANGQGSIDAFVTSFDRLTQGINYAEGASAFLMTKHDLFLSRYVAMTVQPLFQFLFPKNRDEVALAQIHRLYATAGWKNIQLEIGRDNLLWGQGEQGGMMASANPRPLDMIKLSNPYPWRAPWVFRHLGSWKFTAFVSNLGPEQNIRDPYFYGVKLSLRPSRWFEFGLSHTITMGGQGAPSVRWWEPIAELLPFHKWGGGNIGAADIANNAWGFLDFRLTIPPLRGSSIYYDAYIEDSVVRVFRLPDNILNQMSFIVGLDIPRVTRSGEVALKFEFHHVSPMSYRHGRWTSGYTLNQRVIGDPLGPTADGVYASVRWRPKPAYLARLDLAYEDFDSSSYRTETNASGGGDRVLKDVSGPHERRFRASAGFEWLGSGRLAANVAAGVERIQNWDFQVGRSVNNAFLKTGMKLYFPEFTVRTRSDND